MKSIVILLVSYFMASICAAQAPAPAVSPEKLDSGKIIDHVVCIKNSEQAYALYLPSHYSPEHTWPVVFAFDPGARGRVPVELMNDAAEKHGFIVLGSNNSRNGSWKPEADAAEAMLQDAQRRFSVDLKRIYFAGFSGGARVASQLAQLCKCAAGVLLSGAGFSQNSPPSREAAFPVFSAVGNLDFNYSEVVPMQERLEQQNFPHWLRVFDGPHQWAPPEVMNEAFAWFRIQAMRDNREPRDEAFLSTELKSETAAAEKFSGNGDQLAAWRQYKQIASTYEGIPDVTAFRVKADELGRTRAVLDALKRERSDFSDQERLSGQILGALQAKGNIEAPRSEDQTNVAEDLRDLRIRSEKEKKPDRAVVLKRALAGIFIGTIETGSDALEKKDYRAAARYFSAAAEAKPDAEWPLRQLAIAQALDKDRKSALETLRRIKPIDRNAFLTWMKAEPAFQEMRARGDLKAFDE